MKKCSKCKMWKPLGEFHQDSRRKDGAESDCGKCANRYSQQYYQIHQKEKRKWQRQYHQSLKGKLSHMNYHHARRLRYKITDITTEWLLKLFDKTKFCPLCNVKMVDQGKFPNSKSLDHMIPLNIKCGGTHTMDNVRVICLTCNLCRPKDGGDYLILPLDKSSKQ